MGANWKYIPEVILALSTCAIGIGFTSLFNLGKSRKAFIGILGLILLAGFLGAFCARSDYEKEIQAKNAKAFVLSCKRLFENENYDGVHQLIQIHQLNDAPSNMIFAHMLANGYGINRNINESIQYYKTASAMGDERAESNMVVVVVKNCATSLKNEVLEDTYASGNEMAVKYVDYVINYHNSNLTDKSEALDANKIWDMEEAELLGVLNGPFFCWVASNVTYKSTIGVLSTPTFTRKFLYKNGNNYVYEECSLIEKSGFPEWLVEDIW